MDVVSYLGSVKLQSKSMEKVHRYPRSEELQSKSRMEREMLPENCKIKKQVNE